MPTRYLVSGADLIRIFCDRECGFVEAGTDGRRIVLEHPSVDAAIVISPHEAYSYTEIEDWVAIARMTMADFERLRARLAPTPFFD